VNVSGALKWSQVRGDQFARHRTPQSNQKRGPYAACINMTLKGPRFGRTKVVAPLRPNYAIRKMLATVIINGLWGRFACNLQLLGLYESRIQRRFEKNMVEIRTLQAERKASLEQALEEADLLCQLAESKGEQAEPSQFVSVARFDFSATDITRLVLRRRSLREARKKFQDPRKPSKIAA
jgi:hypothetical protein